MIHKQKNVILRWKFCVQKAHMLWRHMWIITCYFIFCKGRNLPILCGNNTIMSGTNEVVEIKYRGNLTTSTNSFHCSPSSTEKEVFEYWTEPLIIIMPHRGATRKVRGSQSHQDSSSGAWTSAQTLTAIHPIVVGIFHSGLLWLKNIILTWKNGKLCVQSSHASKSHVGCHVKQQNNVSSCFNVGDEMRFRWWKTGESNRQHEPSRWKS